MSASNPFQEDPQFEDRRTLFEKSQGGNGAWSLPVSDPSFQAFELDPSLIRETPIGLPEISELDLIRHFSTLARCSVGIDTTFYPLGSCTMKLNPRVNEWAASLLGFTSAHPLADDSFLQGSLQLIYELLEGLCEVCGMDAGSLCPNAGAQGEFSGVKMIAAYHRCRGEQKVRTQMLIPDSAHGTNPATARMAGFEVVSLTSNAQGELDLDVLRAHVGPKTAGLMLTNPSTLGLFVSNIAEVTEIVHEAGGLLYYDGANLNPILNVARPGQGMGFDVMHINLHKTFSTPHGAGGPGAAPVLCNEKLKPFLPTPRVEKQGESFKRIWNSDMSIGPVASFMGNFGIYLRAYLYFRMHGHKGLRRIAEHAVLNANYLKAKIAPLLHVPFKQHCMHEFVVQVGDALAAKQLRALDLVKRLLDYGFHPPTVYFPLIVKECLLIEPTENESKDTLDRFVEAMSRIVQEGMETPDQLKQAPYTCGVSRLDEVRAAKHPILRHTL